MEDWGEKNSGKRSPTVFVLDVVAKTIRKVLGQKATSSYGQPQWTPEGGLLMVCPPGSCCACSYSKFELFVFLSFHLHCYYCSFNPQPAPKSFDVRLASYGHLEASTAI